MKRTVISVHILTLVSVRKNICKHKYTQWNCFQNNTALLYFILGRASKIIPVYLRMDLYSQIFKSAYGRDPLPIGKSVNIRPILYSIILESMDHEDTEVH